MRMRVISRHSGSFLEDIQGHATKGPVVESFQDGFEVYQAAAGGVDQDRPAPHGP